MKFYVLETSIADGAQASAVTVKEDFNEARMVFHQIRASALANENVTYNLAMVINDEGRVFDSEYHGSTEVVAEPEISEVPEVPENPENTEETEG